MNALLSLTLTLAICQAETLPPPLIDLAPIIRDLGGDFKSRTAATRKLSAMGETARPALSKAAADDDLEIARRATMLLHWLNSDRRKRAADAVDAMGTMPCIDFAWWDTVSAFCADAACRERLWRYYERAEVDATPRACDVTKDGWWCYRTATRMLCIDMLEGGVPLPAVRAFIAEMYGRELVFRKACGFPPFPVIQE